MICQCHYCGKDIEISVGQYNYRVLKHGLNVYCDRKCAGLGRRQNKTKEQLKEEKRLYDIKYRNKNKKKLKKKRAEWFKKDYAANPEKYKGFRKARQEKHNEYCRKPKYKKYKKGYDQKYRAKKFYGGYAEAFIALLELARIVDNRQAKRDQKIFNKSQKRKRNASKNIKRQELESCTVGIYQPG